MKKKKEKKTVVQQKITIVNSLIDNGFRCKDDEGGFLSITETDDILMNMPLSTLEHIQSDYQHVIEEKTKIKRVIKPLYNSVMHKTGLSHFIRL